jgi:hypothetical protein
MKYQQEIVAGQDKPDPPNSVKVALTEAAKAAEKYMDIVLPITVLFVVFGLT